MMSVKKILFPQRCRCCFKLCDENNLCDSCAAKMKRLRTETFEKTDEKSIDFIDRLYSSYYYRDNARNAVLNAKYRDMSSFLNSFENDVKDDIVKIFSENSIDMILSSPFYKTKLYSQEHDLPYEMAEEIARMTGITHIQCVEKTRKTDIQHTLDRDRRKANLINAFRVTGDIKDKTILVVDDVVTTGSTLSEIATELKMAGCKSVIAYTYTFDEKNEVKTDGRK